MMTIEPIAEIHSGFSSKFGIPRQSGLVDTTAQIVFLPKYRVAEAIRGMDAYSHLWLIWEFSEAKQENWSPTVRPPRLGGNTRMGVFATRSPFRPNNLGLSCVKLISISETKTQGTVLTVEGADLLDGTPIYDIKPYLPFTDAHPEASSGFAGQVKDNNLQVIFDCDVTFSDEKKRDVLQKLLSEDPRPHYQNDPTRVYAFEYDNLHICFIVENDILHVTKIFPTNA